MLALPGVFNDEARSLAKALRLRDSFAARHLDFVTCSWSANNATEMQAVLADIFTRCRARAGDDDALDKLFEDTARGAGRAFWRDIERHAYAAAMPCDPDAGMWNADKICEAVGGDLGFIVMRLSRICADAGKPLHLLASGAGGMVVDGLLMRGAVESGSADPGDWLPGLGKVVLTFPAVPMQRAKARILALANARPGSVTIIAPSVRQEERLITAGYGRSILQLVSRSFLGDGLPMLGSSWPAPASCVCEVESKRTYRLDQTELEDDPEVEKCVMDAITMPHRTIIAPQPQTFIQPRQIMDTVHFSKITLAELNEKIVEGTLTQEEADHYLMLDQDQSGPFSPVLVVNPDTVVMPAIGSRSALALNSANAVAQWLRRARYERRIASGYDGLRLTADGDSWFQYPVKLTDVIDYASEPYAVFDTSAAGDLLEDMAKKKEYLAALKYSGGDILLLSAGGNDVCAGGKLATHLEDFDPVLTKPADYLKPSYQDVQNKALAAYEKICREVNQHFPKVRIIVHGYDYFIPDDGRWLGKPMAKCGIRDRGLQRAIAAEMIDQFNRGLRRMAGRMAHVHYVDCRGAVPDAEWYDELHPTNAGYAKVASRILTKVKEISAPQPRSTDLASPNVHRNAAPGNRAYSLHVGVNSIDRIHYGIDGKLEGCENDARAMRELAQAQGYESHILLTRDATREAVIAEMHRAARDLRNGDQFLFTFAAHGARIKDLNGDEAGSRNGKMDSTLCLYDAQFIDDEMWHIYAQFDEGVRIMSIGDTCHSGTLARGLRAEALQVGMPKARSLSTGEAQQVYDEHVEFYTKLAMSVPHVNGSILTSPVKTNVRASYIHFGACQDEQKALDGAENGAFTTALLRVWDQGKFQGDHYRLFEKICDEMTNSSQTPNLFPRDGKDDAFFKQRPFIVPSGVAAHGDAVANRDNRATDHRGQQTDPLYLANDDEDMPEDMSATSYSRAADVPDDIVERFRDFMKPVGLKHFDASEFLTLGGAHFGNGPAGGLNEVPPSTLWANIIPTAIVLDALRDRLGVRVRITNAYRTPAYNAAVKGASKSWHLQFRACDVIADDVAPAKVADVLTQLRNEAVFTGGIGRYDGFTHIDTRGVNVDWSEVKKTSGPSLNDSRVKRLRGFADTMAKSPRASDMRDMSVDALTKALADATGAVNGPAVLALDQVLSPDQRRAVMFSTQFAQRAADAASDRMTDRSGWWSTYGAALAAVGWTVGGSVTRDATTKDLRATVDQMVLELMASLPGSGGLRAIRAVLDGLRGLASDDEPLVLLDKQTSFKNGGAVQIGEATLTKNGLSLTTGAIQFEKVDDRTQILFAKWGKSSQGLWLAAEQMNLNQDFYFSIAQQIVEERLGDAAARIKAIRLDA